MNVVALVTQKGGAGKSTLASNLAVAAFLRGERVFVCDLDPLQSLVKWSKARKALDIPVEHIPSGKLEPALASLERDGVTLVVVDTPGGDTRAAEEAVDAADFCILPARPNALDLWASETTLARVKARRREFAFLLTQCPPSQQNLRVARGAEALQEMGALLAPLVASRVDYQEAIRLGLGVCELKPSSAAAREMGELWGSLSARLAGLEKRGRERVTRRDPYLDFFDQAARVGDIYSDFLRSFLPAERDAAAEPVAAPSEADGDKRLRRGP
jgi:chromosome partitioning protein